MSQYYILAYKRVKTRGIFEVLVGNSAVRSPPRTRTAYYALLQAFDRVRHIVGGKAEFLEQNAGRR
jgi:hypothetical protein